MFPLGEPAVGFGVSVGNDFAKRRHPITGPRLPVMIISLSTSIFTSESWARGAVSLRSMLNLLGRPLGACIRVQVSERSLRWAGVKPQSSNTISLSCLVRRVSL